VRSGAITVVPAVVGFDDGGVRLADGSLRTPDAIIAATGYRPDLEAMVGHLDVLDDRGIPRVHGAQTLPHAPGLYFVGIKIELAGLIREIALEARAVARGELAPQPVSR
jgi:cation diffusion facilitator CzcD-associated flavoprotein CzcO